MWELTAINLSNCNVINIGERVYCYFFVTFLLFNDAMWMSYRQMVAYTSPPFLLGSIPAEIVRLTNLKSLDLHNNEMTGRYIHNST